MSEMQTAVVIPVGPGRIPNLVAVMESLGVQTVQPRLVVLVCDGPEAKLQIDGVWKLPTAVLDTPKHKPGMEQPRNIGARLVSDLAERDARFAGITHLWFLDSDVIVRPRALEYYSYAYGTAQAWRCPDCGTPKSAKLEERGHCECGYSGADWKVADSILVGPYDWLPPGKREPDYELRNDPDGVPPPGRWDRFDRHEPDTPVVNDIFAGLACFSGNLVWPVEEFKRVGGFWNELHHGRCEDGELGVRAVSMGVPITFVRDARGWHLFHERNMNWIIEANQRDVALLDQRHPDLHGCCTCEHPKHEHTEVSKEVFADCQHEGCECKGYEPRFFVVDEDGKRFNYRCEKCGEEMNAVLSWGHRAMHARTEER